MYCLCGKSVKLLSADFVVEQGDIQGMVNAIEKICQEGKENYSKACRDRAVRYFNKEERFQEYINLYNQILSK